MSATAVLHRPHQGRGEQRTLAANTIVALLIAVAGLLAAGSLPLTTPADAGTVRTSSFQGATEDPAAAGRRSAALQAALLAEVAAQRGDALAEDAQLVARASLSAAGTARQQQLSAAEVATQAAAVRLAEQIAQARLEAAIAARRAALDEAARAAQAAADQDGTTQPGTTQPDTTLGGQATTPVTGTAGTLPAGTRGALPISTGVVGTPFGARGIWARYHTGLDFRAAYGTPIHSVLPGRVVFAGSSGDWAGNHVAVRHADGRTTMYSHMSRVAVSAGQTVQVGQVLGYVGQTGRAFGAHLHFELYPRGARYGDVYSAIDPTPWLRSIGVHTH